MIQGGADGRQWFVDDPYIIPVDLVHGDELVGLESKGAGYHFPVEKEASSTARAQVDGGIHHLLEPHTSGAEGMIDEAKGFQRGSLEVGDLPCGFGVISADDLDNIFKPGYTTKESGSGFGLSIVDRIIKEHKGSIHISSREAEGTVVKIHLPVDLESEPIQTSLRMRPVVYEDPSELIFTEVDQIVGI